MNAYDYFIVTHAELRVQRTRILLELRDDVTPANTVRWVSAPEPCIAKDRSGVLRRWESFPFKPSSISSQLGSLAGLTELSIGNVDNALTPFLEDDTLADRKVDLLQAWLDPETFSMLAQASRPIFSVEVDSAVLKAGIVTLKLREPDSLVRRPFPPWREVPTCQLGYGEAGCGPKGTMTRCNHTPSTSGGCGDPNSVSPSAAGGKLALGRFDGFIISAADL